ncbi:hypothetical protein [Glycomyces xiaoerkulensis]|uniref:hypothetical protein n=1 Tax=Glycomyces xiaoerkulensis TaxID=2038139 RepID=UPI0013001346|nr:hypothetical protein [Glycomyces xiaoerkulensis]
MGYSLKRYNSDGERRWTAVYFDRRGDRRSAGTFSTKKQADKKWKAAEAEVDAQRGDHLVRGQVSFRQYVEEIWLPNITVEVKTREVYTYQLYAHVMDLGVSPQMGTPNLDGCWDCSEALFVLDRGVVAE